jgi:uncharacterized membrane protein
MLGWVALGLGATQLVAPKSFARFIGVSEDHSTVIRLCGVREVATGLGMLSEKAAPSAAAARVAGDALDLALLSAAMQSDSSDRNRVAATIATVLGVTAMDVTAASTTTVPWLQTSIPNSFSAQVAINASPERLYGLWRDVQNLPRFMERLESVTRLDDRHSRWVIRTAQGAKVEWDSEITEDVPNERIAWHAAGGLPYSHQGQVIFQPLGKDRGTTVLVRWELDSKLASVGAALAMLLGDNPKVRVTQELRAFKQWVETGEMATTRGQPSGCRSLIGRVGTGRER